METGLEILKHDNEAIATRHNPPKWRENEISQKILLCNFLLRGKQTIGHVYVAICLTPCYFFFVKRGDVNEMQSHAHSQLKHHIQQPLFKLTTSSLSQSQPQQTTASYFASPNINKSAHHGHQLNIRPVNSPSNSYFRQRSPRQKEKGSFVWYSFILLSLLCC